MGDTAGLRGQIAGLDTRMRELELRVARLDEGFDNHQEACDRRAKDVWDKLSELGGGIARVVNRGDQITEAMNKLASSTQNKIIGLLLSIIGGLCIAVAALVIRDLGHG